MTATFHNAPLAFNWEEKHQPTSRDEWITEVKAGQSAMALQPGRRGGPSFAL
jgi:hypothetical protein